MDESLKNFLEEQMDRKQDCTIRFRSVEGGVSEIRAQIIGLDEVSGRWMIDTDAGMHIGVDQLVEVNGRPAGHFC